MAATTAMLMRVAAGMTVMCMVVSLATSVIMVARFAVSGLMVQGVCRFAVMLVTASA
ncbi:MULTISPECIES: hypothetical protein [unclassified Desulfovibrio]|uniref:hypothetical protein n=1 Tax=unclassified Desulfovibrio TaxID=2593640 RepID=UPI001C8AC1EA|nr:MULTISPECIES: hypothetical protein [unclassified Desulfovibrio]